MQRLGRIVLVALFVLAATMVVADGARAGGVEIQEVGRGMGNAFAGVQAEADDASVVWWNPAGMTRTLRHRLAGAGYAIWARADFVHEGSMRAPGLPFTGEAGETDEIVLAPAAYGVFSVNKCLKLGLGVNAPFGLVTDWGRTWQGRYYGTKSGLVTININPAIAYRLSRKWSIGVGGSIMYADVELGNAIDFGAALGGGGPGPQALDGHLKITGDDWSFGFNAGVLFEPTPRTRIGLTYRSRVKHELEGDADFEVPAAAAGLVAATGRFVDTTATADVEFPDQIALGIYHELSPKWAVLGSVVWTGWSTFDEIVVDFGNPGEPSQTLDLDWDDAFRFALGVNFRPNRCWTIRLGTAFDNSPIPDSTRTPRIPLNDRIWATLGVGYQVSRRFSVDFSYAHLFVTEGDIDLATPEAGILSGYVDGIVDIVGLQFNLDF